MPPIEVPPEVQNPLILTAAERERVHRDIMIGSVPSGTFFIMNFLAAVIAGYGLLQDSPAVVIGAMLVAMMLGPIVGLGLAVLQHDPGLLRTTIKSIVLGTVWVIAIGLVIGLVHNEHVLTGEILGRTSPNVMDLMIALAGGFAGALATVSSRLPVAVVGVGVATALVPPLVTCGILLSHGQFALAGGAFLLTLTNMVAIQFASSVILWLAGFRRDRQTDKQVSFWRMNLWSAALLVILGAILTANLTVASTRQRLDLDVAEILRAHLNQGNNRLVESRLVLDSESQVTVMAFVQGDHTPSDADIQTAQTSLPRLPNGQGLHLQVRYVKVAILNADP